MRTLLSQFCEEFDQVIRPMVGPLRKTVDVLGKADTDLPARGLRAQFSDLGIQMKVLADKVAEQQAYVLIFGPLKSGKSTLMNALAASYVSEVTSLPAYPCMVYVNHSDKNTFTVTRYDGRTEMFADGAALHMHVSRAHRELADRIRAAEGRNEAFDPAEHFPEAIRRIDVKIPAGELDESSAVLVDTPGLYSRMRFGYDTMTRDFRNVAACAIFVVKSDNLFLEQVFEEFTELLDLFKRIFLVVNLDTTKRDLDPKGRLVPSLEGEDPARLIEAFEDLSMSAPLKQARDEGRLNIYPVDLMHSASERLQASEGITTDEGTPDSFRAPSSFDTFLTDLTEYLNSTDYLVAFLGDSMRRAFSLLTDTADACALPSVGRLRESVRQLETQHLGAKRKSDAIKHLSSFDWTKAFAELEEGLRRETLERTRDVAVKTSLAVDGAIDKWFHSDASLQDLIENELVPLLGCHQQDISSAVINALEDSVRRGDAGVGLPPQMRPMLSAAGVDLGAVGTACLAALDRTAIITPVGSPLTAEPLPVRKTIWDWCFFRSRKTIRRRLFGPDDSPSVRISPEAKKHRLGEAGKESLRRELDKFKGRFFPKTLKRAYFEMLSSYAQTSVQAVGEAISKVADEIGAELGNLERKLAGNRNALESITQLEQVTKNVRARMDEIESRYVQTDPDMLLQPVGAKALPSLPAAGLVGGTDAETDEATKLEDASN